ncbi:Glutathione S-transferase 5 [Didymella keratinophila]|nr:Glutathione S-transferase 5 [Didymella keratinophila]
MQLYDSTVPSGNAYKVHLLLSHLETPYTVTSLHILPPHSESHELDFLAINPNGKVPALRLDDGIVLTESNAILFYLADGTPYLPADKLERAQVLQWMFFEQFSHEPYVSQIEQMRASAQFALDVMEVHLSQGKREWFVGRNYSIADIALFAYTQHAEILGFRIGEIVKTWLRRVESTKGWIRIAKDPTGKNPF